MTTFYAIQWTYGRAVNEDGTRAATYFQFPSKKRRDEWVDQGSDYATDPGHREAIPASDPELRSLQRRERNEGAYDLYIQTMR